MRPFARRCIITASKVQQRCSPGIATADARPVLTGFASLTTISSSSSFPDHSLRVPWLGLTALGLGTALALGLGCDLPAQAKAAEPQEKAAVAAAAPAPAAAPAAAAAASQKKELPVFSKEEVAKHRTPEAGIWVTCKVNCSLAASAEAACDNPVQGRAWDHACSGA